MPSFIDEATISLKGGDGGDGIVSFRHEKYVPKGGPDGGDGGHGGSVYIQADSNINTLSQFRQKKKFIATPGERGGNANKHGKSGADLTIQVPVGTIARINEQGTSEYLLDLSQIGQKSLIAKGGHGGRGNARYATSTQRRPTKSTPGQAGQEVLVELELKLLADIGLVGLPNAGKSTLLANLTDARPKVGSYPFTTLEPNLGVAHYDGLDIILADIPGLIEGASLGKGLGDQFLKHIERTKALFHLVSLSPQDGDPWQNYMIVNQELGDFNTQLLEKDITVLLTKADTVGDNFIESVKQKFISRGVEVIVVNIFSEIDRQAVIKRAVAVNSTVIKKANIEATDEVSTYTLNNLPNKFAARRRQEQNPS